MQRLVIIAALALLSPACASAQRRDEAQIRNSCRLAVQVVRSGRPAPHTAWAYEQIPECGAEGGAALSMALKANRGTTDIGVLHLVTQPSSRLVDGQIFEAALAVAGDEGASVQARVFALRTLVYAGYPGAVSGYADMVRTVAWSSCIGEMSGIDFEPEHGTPLASDAFTRAVALAEGIASDVLAPPDLRRAGVCARETLRRRIQRDQGT